MLMKVTMRQFGIGLLIVKDDNIQKDDWPYETVNYLDELGSRVFLPLGFGMIYLPKDGNVSILQRMCHSSMSYPVQSCNGCAIAACPTLKESTALWGMHWR
jgi:hypothetical protein